MRLSHQQPIKPAAFKSGRHGWLPARGERDCTSDVAVRLGSSSSGGGVVKAEKGMCLDPKKSQTAAAREQELIQLGCQPCRSPAQMAVTAGAN